MCEQSAKHHGGAVVRAVQDRAVRCVFAILPTPTAALEMATLLMLRVSTERKDTAKHDGRGGDVTLQMGMATGQVLDLGGCNAFGDPVNTAFKLGEDVATTWEMAVSSSTYEQLPEPLAAVFSFETRRKSISGVELVYFSQSWTSETVQAQVATKINVLTVSADSNLRLLDWSAAIGKGHAGLMLPDGAAEKVKEVVPSASTLYDAAPKLHSSYDKHADDADADAPEPSPARPLRRLTTSKFVRHGEKDDSDDETPREKKP